MADETTQGLSDKQIKELVDAVKKGRGVEKIQTFSPDSIGGDPQSNRQAVGRRGGAPNRTLERQLKDFRTRYGTEGVELDTGGVGVVPRGLAGLAQTPQDKLAVYNKYFGAENVKPVGKGGRYLIRVMRDGKPVDILDDEPELTGRDILDLSGYAPEVAAEFAAAAKLLPRWTPAGLMGYLATAGASVATGKAVGAAKDVWLRLATDQPVDPKEIASRRLKETLLESTLGAFLPWGSQKAINKLRPGSIAGPVESIDKSIARQGKQGSEALEKAGIQAPLTAGEQTGSRKIQEYEAYGEKVGKLLDPTGELRAAQEAALKKGQASLTSKASTATEPLGQRVSKELGRAEADVVRGAQDASERALKTAEGRAREATGFDVSHSAVDAGDKVRSGLQRVVNEAGEETDRLYKQARELLQDAGGDERFVIPTETQKVGKRLSTKETLVKEIREEVTEESKLFLESGEPMPPKLSEKVTTEPIGWAIEAYNKAKSFADMGGTPQSIEAMRRARSVFGDAIGAAEARNVTDLGGGFSLGDAKQFYKSLSKDIDDSLKTLSPDVAAAYKAANTQAHDAFEKYTKNKLWHQIRHSAEEGGFGDVSEIISYFGQNKGKVGQLRELGKLLDPEDFAELKRGIVADLTSDATVKMPSGMEFVDFGKLQKSLVNLRPEYKFEIFGGKDQFRRVGEALDDFAKASELGHPKTGILRSPSSIDVRRLEELGDSINDPRMFQSVKEDILEAIQLKDVQQKQFNNEITKKIKSRSLTDGDVNTDEFIDDFVLKAKDRTLVRTALKQLSPELHEEIARETLKRVFQQSNDLAKQTLDELAEGGAGVIRGPKLKEMMYGGKGNRAILEEVIPAADLEMMDNLIKYQLAIEQARRNAGSVGAFAKDYMLTSPIKSAGTIAMASLIHKPAMQSFLKKAAASPGALNRVAAALGKSADWALPEKVGPLRMVMSSKLDKEVVELATLFAEATKDLDDVQREAFKKTYITLANEQPEMSEEEIGELVSGIVGKKKAGKSLVEERLKARMPSRKR